MNGFLSKKQYIPLCLTYLLLLSCFLIPKLSISAVMPTYERLAPITSSLTTAIDVAADQSGRLYVAEFAKNSLAIFDENGLYASTLSGLSHPLCVDVDVVGRMYIGNKDTANVEVYDSGFTLLFELGSGNGEFVQPNDLEVAASGQIYVVDQGADIVKVFNPDGTFTTSFGGSGNGEGQFHRPVSIAIDEGAAEVIVLDHQLSQARTGKWIDGARIQIFDMNGVYKRGFTKFGIYAQDLFKPQRVTVDEQGGLYVTDSFHNVVFVYDSSDGLYLGTVYNLENPLRTPVGITLDGNLLYVATREAGTVEVYQLDHGTTTAVPKSLTGDKNSTMTIRRIVGIKDSPIPRSKTTASMQAPAKSVSTGESTPFDKTLPITDNETSESERRDAEFPWPLFKHLLSPVR